MEAEWDVPLLLQLLKRDVLHAGIGRMPVWRDRQRLANHLLRRVAETLFLKAHALGQLAEEPDIGPRLARRLDGLLGELYKVVPVRALNVCVLQKCGRGQNVIGVVGGVGKEQLVDHGEEVRSHQAAAHGVLVGSHRTGIRVVNEERMNRRAFFRLCAQFRQRQA